MSDVQHPNRALFVNLPIESLDRSVTFFTKLGFTLNPLFTDETTTCMLVGDQAYFMLLEKERFASFLPEGRTAPEASSQVHAFYAFSVDSRECVDEIVDAALANGGSEMGETEDHGFMYSRPFGDPDGNCFNVFWMDPVAAEAGPEAHAAQTANA
ncbi:MAG: Glyoxalase/bleomycin resistance protein/dioxygenase [Thermoleophilia bacterium]|nr:Glyoxalase/bleomycin resistance protein/dioxygenase [Thermoleophilia bacterium]